MSKLFGSYLRQKRERLRENDPEYSIRRVAERIGIHHSYLSKVERGEPATLTEKRIVALAVELDEDPDLLMAMNGKLAEFLRRAVIKDPAPFMEMVDKIRNGV